MSDWNSLGILENLESEVGLLNRRKSELEKTLHIKDEEKNEIDELSIRIYFELWKIPLPWDEELRIENYASSVINKNNTYTRNYTLSQAVLNLDSLTKSQIETLTKGNRFFKKILKIWREFLNSLNVFYEYDIEGRIIKNTPSKKEKILIYSKARITRKQSLEILKKSIENEYKRIEFLTNRNILLFINYWDFSEVLLDLKKTIDPEKINVDYEMFPGEFRIQSSPKLGEIVQEFEKNKFVLDLSEIFISVKNSSLYKEIFLIYRPTEFCPSKFFSRKFRNRKHNTFFHFWYCIKSRLYHFWCWLKDSSSSIALIISGLALILQIFKK